MSTPVCPEHGTPMRPGKTGGFYCSRKVGEGWCSQRVSAKGRAYNADTVPGFMAKVDQPVPIAAVVPAVMPKGPPSGMVAVKTNDDTRVAAALEFAGRLYHACGPGGTDEALACAREALKLFGG